MARKHRKKTRTRPRLARACNRMTDRSDCELRTKESWLILVLHLLHHQHYYDYDHSYDIEPTAKSTTVNDPNAQRSSNLLPRVVLLVDFQRQLAAAAAGEATRVLATTQQHMYVLFTVCTKVCANELVLSTGWVLRQVPTNLCTYLLRCKKLERVVLVSVEIRSGGGSMSGSSQCCSVVAWCSRGGGWRSVIYFGVPLAIGYVCCIPILKRKHELFGWQIYHTSILMASR